MKTMLLATAVAFALGFGSAHADSGGVLAPNSFFTQLPGVIAAPATGHATAPTTTQGTPDGRPVQLYPSQSRPGTWLYEPEARPPGG